MADGQWPIVAPNDDGVRPGGLADRCFYCNQKIGDPHNLDCVIVHKRVRLRYTFEVEVEVPHYWTEADTLHHRNDSTWCANNAFADIDANSPGGCPCPIFKCEWVGIVDDTPARATKSREQMDADAAIRATTGRERMN